MNPAGTTTGRAPGRHRCWSNSVGRFIATRQSSWTDTQIRSKLGAISKVARKLFGNKVWPVRRRQGSEGVMRYFMPEGIAEWDERGLTVPQW